MANNKQKKLIEDNYRLVWSVVNRFSYNKEDKEDLFQSGCIGLIMAANKFDATKGFAFSTFAIPYILGEIRNYLREKSHFKISKQTFRISKEIKQILEKNDKISVKQLAKQLNLSYEDVLLGYNLSTQGSVMSLDKEFDTNMTVSDFVLSDERFSYQNEKLLLNDIYRELNNDERKVFYYRFYFGLTQSEVAKKLAVSQSKISRIEKRISSQFHNYYKLL